MLNPTIVFDMVPSYSYPGMLWWGPWSYDSHTRLISVYCGAHYV